MKKSIVPALLILAASSLPADVLHLRDGRTIDGRLVSASSRVVQFLAAGQNTSRTYSVTTIDRVEFGSGNSTTSQGQHSSGASPAVRGRSAAYSIPAGSVVSLRMIDSVNSDRTDIGDTYRASLESPIIVGDRTLAAKGADATVRIAKVDQGGVVGGNEEVALVLNDITINGRRYRVESEHAAVRNEAQTKDNATVIGGGAVVGAIIGAIAGGGKGAAIGAATGAGAGVAVQAIRGQKIEIPSEMLLDFRLAKPLYID